MLATNRVELDDLWTPQEVAEYLQVTRGFIYKLLHRGELPYLRIGTAIRISGAAFQSYLRAQQTPAPLVVRRPRAVEEHEREPEAAPSGPKKVNTAARVPRAAKRRSA
jgi:excisionase family DNA binding protein